MVKSTGDGCCGKALLVVVILLLGKERRWIRRI
jgi:hypothetical protein